jgi:hypothetical protein
LKLVEANAKYDKLEVLKNEYKTHFDKNIIELRKIIEQFLLDNRLEPEDPYAWPFEEYK